LYCRIGAEERKLLLAQRKLESIRVLDELLSRVKVTILVSTRAARLAWVAILVFTAPIGDGYARRNPFYSCERLVLLFIVYLIT
jgi:hypothetical protein